MKTNKIPVTMRIHRDTFPRTDHGHTWIESVWYEYHGSEQGICWDGKRCSPIIPAAGCCERLNALPGGHIPQLDREFEERNFDVKRTVKSETVHDEHYYRVGPVSIVPAD